MLFLRFALLIIIIIYKWVLDYIYIKNLTVLMKTMLLCYLRCYEEKNTFFSTLHNTKYLFLMASSLQLSLASVSTNVRNFKQFKKNRSNIRI